MEGLKKSFLVRGNNIVGFGGRGEENTIESISVNGVDIAPDENKNVDITVPSIDGLTKDADLATVAKSGNYEDLDNKPEIPSIEGLAKTTDIPTKVSELENDSKYQTESDITTTLTDYATKTYVGEQIANAEHLKREIVTVLPSDEEASDNIIYMLKVESATGNDKYQEYMKIDGTVQMVGDTSVDLTEYAKTAEIPTTVAELTDSADYAKSADIPTSLPANGGNSTTVNGHTVKSDVPENAVFTDTVYDDTEVKESIDELNSNLDTLEFGEIAGGKNLWDEQWKIGVYTESDGIFSPSFDYFCSKNKIKVKPNTIYRFISPEIRHYIYQYDVNGNYIGRISIVEDVFSTNDNVEYIQFVMEREYGKTYNHDIAIIEGTSGIYEPYIPSVKMLADEVNQQNESLAYNASKNMLLVNVGTISGVTITSKDKSTALLNGTSTANVSVFTTADVIPSGSYHLKLSNKVGSIFVWDTIHSKTIIDVDNTECNFTLTESSKLLVGFSVGNGHSFTNFEASGQLEKGTVATDFVPYNGKSNLELTNDVVSLKNDLDTLEFSEIAGGKNLLNTKEFIKWVNQYTNGGYSNDEITISPVNVYLYNNFFKFSDTDIDVTLSVKSLTFENGSNPRVCLVNSAGTIIGTVTTDTPSASGLGCGIKIDFTDLPTSITIKELMIEEGSVATEYKPYFPSNKMLEEEISKQNDSLSVIGKCKNLLNSTLQTTTQNGVTCTANGDGTYTLNGTAGSQTTFVFAQLKSSNLFKNGITYKFCGCPKLNNNIWLLIEKQTSPYTLYASDYGNGGTFTYASNDDTINIFVRMNEGIVLNNVVLKPMVTTNLNATYDDFVPYTGDGETLTHDVAEIKNDLDEIKPSVIGSDWNKSWTYTVSSTTPKMFALHWSNSTVIFCVFYGKVIPFNQPFDGETYTANIDGNTLTVTTSATGILRTI